MRNCPWSRAALVSILALGSALPILAQDGRPDDSTPIIVRGEEDTATRVNGAETDNPTARLEWQRQAWGIVTPAFRQNALREGQKHSNKKNAPGPKWVSIGPTGSRFIQNGSFTGHVSDSGRARTILPHPTHPDVVYFLTSGGGLWRTNNWSSPNTDWSPLTDDLPTTGGGSVAFGKNPNTLYLGLGDPYDQILVGGSVVKSKNGGVSWSELIELGTAVSVRDLKVDTSTNRDIVLVATESGLYRSADEGDTYSAISTFSGRAVWSIVRTSAGWLASSQPCPAANVGLQCGQATTLHLSTDRGATWAPITNAGNVFSNNGRTTLGVGAAGDSVVYAYSATLTDAAMRDVYRSADGGQTWVANGVNSTEIPTNPVAGSMPNMNICRAQCWYNQMILVDPRDNARNTVWIGGDLATAQTTNGGGTWTLKTWWLPNQVPLPYAHADNHAAAFKATGTPTIMLGNDGGLNITTDDGATVSTDKNNGLVSHLYYTVSGNAAFPNVVIGGLQDNGTRLRIDNSTIHNQVIGGDGLGAAYSIDNTNTVIGSVQGSGMRTTLSNNPPIAYQEHSAATAGLSDVGFPFQTSVTAAPAGLDPTGRVFFHFSSARVWRSNNGGLSWILIGSAVGVPSPGLPPARRFRSGVHNLGVSPLDLNRIAVGAGGGFIDITTNGGATWTDIDLITAVPGYQGFVTNLSWQDNQNLWITSVAQATGAVRVIKATIATPSSSWATATYQVKQNGLPDLPVTRVLFDPRDATRATIYAATHVGIYKTTNGGDDWEPYGNGLPTVRVNDIYMPPDGGFIRLATYGRGIWELAQLELVSASLSDDVSSCDSDSVIDNGETGNLTVTLKNQGPNNVNHVTLTLTSSNPNVTFPNGNVASFPPVQKGGESTGSIRVAVNGAAGLESADLKIAIDSPELGLPTPFNVVSTHRVNYDEQLQGSATESVEASNQGWTVAGDPTTVPNIAAWQRRAISPIRHHWYGPDNNGQADGQKPDAPDEQSLTSPLLNVGSGPLTISFQHRFSFEGGNWDGGVVELSTNGGASWVDIGTSAYNGATNAVTSAPIGASRPAFINRMTGWPNFAGVTLNLGTTYANQNVLIRFRIGADESTGSPGWDIDDIAITGITNTPFTALVGETTVCN
ncbi:MAG TPA: hypothetical protein VE974_01455 [Thermoanaerobaculia bacterium]|nr:hypothetical protein [Thermoanaerobaculia bacterium]